MRRSIGVVENESPNASDLSRAFDPEAINAEPNGIRCSTTRKQVEALNAPSEEPMPGALAAGMSHEADFNEQPATSNPPQTSARRKRTNPKRRAARLRREVRMLQRSADFMIPRLPFGRVVREIIMGECNDIFRITVGALDALQTASEMFMTQRFQDAYLLTHHRSRVTLEVRDMALVAYFCKQHGME